MKCCRLLGFFFRKPATRMGWVYKLVGIGAVLLIFVFYSTRHSHYPGTTVIKHYYKYYKESSTFIHYFNKSKPDEFTNDRNEKLILIWTTKILDDLYLSANIMDSISFQGCQESSCKISANKDLLDKSYAILFHLSDLQSTGATTLPTSRQFHQVWVLYTKTPKYTLPNMDLSKYKNVFNWTSSYRLDSDVPCQNGKIIQTWKRKRRSIPSSKTHKYLTFQNLSYLSFEIDISHKTELLAWIDKRMDCSVSDARTEYVNQLKKHIPVHIFGHCGDYICDGRESCKTAIRKYKFLLILEEHICRDFVSPIFWEALDIGVIPVVMSAADYDIIAPPHSVINTQYFNSPKILAQYLTKINHEHHLYKQYFTWKKRYHVSQNSRFTYLCDLCAALHDNKKTNQVYKDLQGWFSEDLPTC